MLDVLADVDLPRGVGGYVVGTALAGVAALLFAVGSVAQHEVTAGTSSGGQVRWRTVLAHRGWLASQGATVLAALVQVAALALAPVAIVQPVLAGGLVMALALRSLRDHRWPRTTEVAGAVLATAGLAIFLVFARPGHGNAGHLSVGLTAALSAVVVLFMLGAARLVRGRAGAFLCGLAAGVGLGLAAVLISAALDVLQHRGVLAALSSASLWAALATSLTAMYCTQVAFSRGSLSLSLPALSVVDPLAAVVAAEILLHEHLSLTHVLIWAPAAVAAAAGVALLAIAEPAHLEDERPREAAANERPGPTGRRTLPGAGAESALCPEDEEPRRSHLGDGHEWERHRSREEPS